MKMKMIKQHNLLMLLYSYSLVILLLSNFINIIAIIQEITESTMFILSKFIPIKLLMIVGA